MIVCVLHFADSESLPEDGAAGSKKNTRTMVYSGRRQHFLTSKHSFIWEINVHFNGDVVLEYYVNGLDDCYFLILVLVVNFAESKIV